MTWSFNQGHRTISVPDTETSSWTGTEGRSGTIFPDDSFPEESCDRGAKPAKKMTRPESFPTPLDAEPISTAALPATAALEPLFMNGTIPEQM